VGGNVRFYRIWAPLALALSLAACASTPEIPYDHTAAGVHTIGVLTPGFPSGATVFLASDVGQSFGLIGAAIDAGIQANRESRLGDALTSQRFVASATFWNGLAGTLAQRGYTVVPVFAPQNRSDFVKQMPPSPSPVDAYLDIVVKDYGYMAAGIGGSNPYRPFLVVQCKLVRASDSSTLMEDQIELNPLSTGGWGSKKDITLSPDPAYAFPGIEDLTNDPKKAADGLGSAFAQTNATIGTLLK